MNGVLSGHAYFIALNKHPTTLSIFDDGNFALVNLFLQQAPQTPRRSHRRLANGGNLTDHSLALLQQLILVPNELTEYRQTQHRCRHPYWYAAQHFECGSPLALPLW